MKKFLLTAIILSFVPLYAHADESTWESLDTTDYSHTTQNLKYFSEKEYQNAIDSYKNKFQKPKKTKSKDIKTPTTPFSDAESNPEYKYLEEVENHKGIIMIPTLCATENGQQIQPGHYTLGYYVDSNNTEWLILSQGSLQTAKISAAKSTAAEGEDTINYAYAKGNGNSVKLFYGNIDVAVEATLHVLD